MRVRGILALGAMVCALSAVAGHAAAAPVYSYTDLWDFGGSNAFGINSAGQVVGDARPDENYRRAVLFGGGSVTDLGVLPGGTHSWGTAISASGAVVGYSTSETGDRAFIYDAGVMTSLGTLGGGQSFGYGINDAGQAVGHSSIAPGGAFHAFLYSGGSMADLGTLGGAFSEAYDINGAGQVVGRSARADGTVHAFVYDGGVMSDLGTLGGAYSYAYGINALGQVVGASETADGSQHAFLYSDGVMTDLGTLGGAYSFAADINNLGQIVGVSSTAGGDLRAFLYGEGTMYNIGGLGGTSMAFGINDAGYVVGTSALGDGGDSHAFLAIPQDGAVPEPSTWALMLIGFGGAGAALRNRRRRLAV
ncbi:MAG: PEPxxWA-CTERM sorting domain-containing protein [Alphaproteobacteria bacterium]|nr:PEPxxWA-CTERM sorting domain-containing protein [Alphaproteobacteria bacterium]MBU1514125.1 PEPxxWA-CTERM sorting domain-containing protein [Alphaproteobacteria bacterium]MBU2096226.1 PEPxxWA-CTERM sorting domain-containing protein [Alphaproteobacteria bacterium]MBU2151180.1 PEPxxWA-CTERM sorting domain-containing protein [Alphaproteobacteria bacterium]MBU2307161.1 PEPxxWA-CTERM sorting domain-containing protein [Alphaproteobacteria bacterium]